MTLDRYTLNDFCQVKKTQFVILTIEGLPTESIKTCLLQNNILKIIVLNHEFLFIKGIFARRSTFINAARLQSKYY